MDEFLLKFFPSVYEHKHTAKESDYCKYDSQILQFFSSSLYIAGLLSGFGSSWLANNYGRKRSMLCGGFAFLIGGILNGAAQNIAMLIIGRILLGIGVGCAAQVS
jgi:MFS family permease